VVAADLRSARYEVSADEAARLVDRRAVTAELCA